MDIVKRTVILLVVVTGLVFIGNTDAFKTDGQIITEIRSMADAITKQCTPNPLHICKSYKDRLAAETDVYDACDWMDSFTQCSSDSCKNQTQTLKQILADAMTIPYCTTMAIFPRDPRYWAVAERLSNMSRLCQFKPKTNCDLPLKYVLLSQYVDSLCAYERLYVLCLEEMCLNPSLQLRQKLSEARHDSLCRSYNLPTRYPFTADAPLDDINNIPVAIPYDPEHPVTIRTPTRTTVRDSYVRTTRSPITADADKTKNPQLNPHYSKNTDTGRTSSIGATVRGPTTPSGSSRLPQGSVMALLMTSLFAKYL